VQRKLCKKSLTSKLGGDMMTLQTKLGKEVSQMNRDEILKASRSENQYKDFYEQDIINKGQRVAGTVAILVTCALMVAENVILHYEINYGYSLIILSSCAGLWIYKAIRMKKKHEILLALLWTVLAINAAVLVVRSFMG
jgi:hypothetical protein